MPDRVIRVWGVRTPALYSDTSVFRGELMEKFARWIESMAVRWVNWLVLRRKKRELARSVKVIDSATLTPTTERKPQLKAV